MGKQQATRFRLDEEVTADTWSEAPAKSTFNHVLQAIYVLHPTLGLRTTIFALQLFVDGEAWQKVVYIDRLLQLFKYVPREQLTIPDFVFQHDLEVNGGKGVIVDPRTKYIYQRPSS